jgi:hypothetical protein
MSEVILVDTGYYQEYILDNIRNLQLFGNNVTLIIDKAFAPNFSEFQNLNIIYTEDLNSYSFDQRTQLDGNFRNGFWRSCSKRFFYIYDYMKKFNKTNCFHVENDVMIYKNLSEISIPEEKIMLCMDSKHRCIPSIMYFPNYVLLEKALEKYNYGKNDMENFGDFYNNNKLYCDVFPIINDTTIYLGKNFHKYNAIFDTAAMGQYLGGVDPRNISGDTRGFINETCEIDYSKYKFYWYKKNNLYVPHLEIDGELIPIVNLHIHSKRLHNFMANDPNESLFIKKIYDVIFCIYGCDTIEKYKIQIDKINQTWGNFNEQALNIKYLFFLGEHGSSFRDDKRYIRLPGMKDDYLSASYKQYLGMKYIYENYRAKYIMVCGTDTFINVPKLLKYVEKFNYNDNLYIGGHGCHRTIENISYYYHSGGPGFIITWGVLDKLYECLGTIVEDWLELSNKNNLKSVGLDTACDVSIGYYIQKKYDNIAIIKGDDYEFNHCNYHGHPCHNGQVLIDKIISCHNMSSYDFDCYNDILIQNNYFI